MRQAKSGGEIGKNGEFYKGGQFLPTSEHTVKGAQKHVPTGKQQIAPYVWEVAPEVGLLAIYAEIERYNRLTNKSDCEYVKGQGLVGAILEYHYWTPPIPIEYDSKDDIPEGCYPYRTNRALCAVDSNGAWVTREVESIDNHKTYREELINRWNAGERWFSSEQKEAEFPAFQIGDM